MVRHLCRGVVPLHSYVKYFEKLDRPENLFHSYVKYFHSYVKYFVTPENAVISGIIERFPYIRHRAGVGFIDETQSVTLVT